MQRSSSTRSTVARRPTTNPSSFAFVPKARLTPMVHAIALMLAAGAAASDAQAQQAFSGAWMAQKNMAQSAAIATGRLPNGMPASMLTSPQAQQQRANEQLQRSIGNLNLTARTIAAQQAAQEAARRAALAAGGGVPDGMAEGGLQVDTNSLTAGWANANAPVQTQEGGRTQVTVTQTGERAVLNWESFNVGRNTTLKFEQQPSWAVLNRVNDPQARPSQIQGQIQADGTVMVVNRNGIVFSGSSQVNTRNLLASAVGMTDAQFQRGIYSQALGTGHVPTLANDLVVTPTASSHGAATADVVVEAGARIETRKPQTVTEGGGYVLLAGREVHNRGAIVTPAGQATLAAGDSFVIRKGLGTDGNLQSSTRGNEVTPARVEGSAAGRVSNSGLIQALTGDITLTGRSVEQAGVLVSSTSVNTRGTLHLNAAGDADARVTLAPGSVSAVLLDDSNATALDVQRDTLLKESAILSDGAYNRRDQSLVQIASSGDVAFEADSMTLATGGQVNVTAARRVQLAERAAIDVAGAVGVRVAMASNNVEVNVQGNEQRDAPGNRDSKNLNNANLWIDRRYLVRVPAGTQGHATDRWYTGGGLLEVSGYLNTDGHGIGEWAASGGTVAFAGGELVTRAGSAINVSGGSLDVQTGMLKQSWLKGRDGRLYNLSSAPGDMLYDGVYRGFESLHQRWGKNTTDFFYNPLIAPRERLENGYTVGRDAGRVIVGMRSAVLEGHIDATVFQGERQRNAPDAGLDGYRQSQNAAPRAGQLVIGRLQPVVDADTGALRDSAQALAERIDIGAVQRIAQDLQLDDALPSELDGKIGIDAGWLSGLRLGGFKAYAEGGIRVDADVTLAPGGSIALHATQVDVNADLTARGGNIALGNMVGRLQTGSTTNWLDQPIAAVPPEGYTPGVTLAGGTTLDTRGLWTNLRTEPADIGGLPYMNGGSVSFASTGDLNLHAGSVIDTSSGAALMANGALQGGRGGNITLRSNQYDSTGRGAGALLLDGTLRGHGVKGGGTLTIDTGIGVAIGGGVLTHAGRLTAGEAVPVHLTLAEAFTVPAGTVLPADFSYIANTVAPGEALKVAPMFTAARSYTLPADWVVPAATVAWEYVNVYTKSGTFYQSGSTVPAGTELVNINGTMAPGYVVPADAFPNGMPVSDYTATVAAGTPFARDLVLGEGALLLAGTRLPVDVAVKPLLVLGDSLFRSGFSRYAVSAQQGVQVAAGARVDVAMPVLRADPAAALATATGADPSAVLQPWLPPLWQEDPLAGVLTQRAGADLALGAGSVYSQAPLVVGRGATISVDPGRSLTLTGNAQITIDGTLNAWGGRIGVLPGGFGIGNDADRPSGTANATSIWIGGDAVLDAAGRATTAIDARGRSYGHVGEGGRIEIGAAHVDGAREVDAADAFVVLRPGARLDASGAVARLDVPGYGVREVATDGGVIALSSYRGLFLDGDMRAAAGGAGAAGGTLALNLETPNYGPVGRQDLKGINVEDAVRVPRELVLAQVQGDSGLSGELAPGEREAALAFGRARIGVDRIAAGGFDNLSLLANGLVSFDGSVDLRLGQSLHLAASAIGLAEGSAADAQVRLAAPSIRLAGSTRGQEEGEIMPNPVRGSHNGGAGAGALGLPLVAEGSGLALDAQLIDIVGQFNVGARGNIVQNAGDPLAVERLAFDQIVMRTRGDLRLSQAAAFHTPGSLRLAASQIYPAMNDSGSFVVGERGAFNQFGTLEREFDPARSLDIERIDPAAALPAQPYSVFGRLSFAAATINQGGVVRAPLGEIVLGAVGVPVLSGAVNLLPGSVTSVSANGLTMPYGGTLDGLSYLHDGKDVEWKGVGNDPSVTLAAHAVDVQQGAVLDLRGGGELTGAAFLAGRGGSTDARLNPLVQTSARGSFTLPGLATNPVYAIVPGAQAGYAPLVNEHGAGDPALGRQITIGAGVPGLPAGTYTLLPSTFALLPGAFRVELNGLASNVPPAGVTVPMRNGSYAAAAQMGTAHTAVRDALPTQVFLTPADTLRSYSQYNETSYAAFAIAMAERNGVPRTVLERDAKMLRFDLVAPSRAGAIEAIGDVPALRFAGQADYAPAAGGFGGSALLVGGYGQSYEVLADGAAPTPGFAGVSVHAGALNAIGAPRLGIGALPSVSYIDHTGSSQRANIARFLTGASSIVLREGAVLRAGEVYLVTNTKAGGIVVEQGAGINTLGRGRAAWDSRDGFVYAPGTVSVLAVSNGWLDLLAPEFSNSPDAGAGRIDIGVCATGSLCQGTTQLYSEGTLAASTDQSFELREGARYGTRNLVLSVGGINVGSDAALAAAAARNALPPGLTLNQDILDRLLRGDTSNGAPALENLVLTARDAVNFHDSITLSTIDPATGRSSLERLVLGAPAIYGAGGADAVARIHTGILVWNGAATPPGLVAAGGAGTGSGRLQIDANQIEFGYGPNSRPDTIHGVDRLVLGFKDVVFNASERVTANHTGSLSVYQSQGAWDDVSKGYAFSGGNLHIETPLLTGQAGSVNRIKAGGDIVVAAPGGMAAPALTGPALAEALGAEIGLDAGGRLTLDSRIALPSGKLTASAGGDVRLEDGAQLDLAGRRIDFFDVPKYSWGGDAILESRGGDVRQAAGSRIDLSAEHNRAGKLTVLALGEGAGTVALDGAIAGASSGAYDAGGTYVPYAAGGADIRGQHIDDFAGLNRRLTEGGVIGSRSFQLKQGDLVLGDELKAREISVSVDGGRLAVEGTVDASGAQAGSIRLAARDGVTLGAAAVLDAHSRVLRLDSYGQVIEAPNRAVIEIDAGSGRLVLASGARMDVRAGTDGQALSLGTVELSAERLGGARGNDIAIDAGGTLQIDGARAVTVNGFWTYKDAAPGTDAAADGRPYQVVNQAYLDAKHADSQAFMTNVLANGGLMNTRLAGLRAYGDAFHLRPGVTITSATPDGDLHIDGDIDLSGHRYASVNPHTPQTGVHGSGEAGALVLRAGGNLNVYGSITDGFDTSVLQPTPSDRGWVLIKGRVPWGGDLVVPRGGVAELAEGTFFQPGRTLNYALPMQAMSLRAGTVLATTATLAEDFVLPAGTVLGGAVRDAAGNVLHAAGTVLATAVTLQSGMKLDAGNRLPGGARVAAMTWPAGVPLPFPIGAVNDTPSPDYDGDGLPDAPANGVILAGSLKLAKGAVVPAETLVLLPGGVDFVNLRPADAGGDQGRNLALAPMLAEGSQSWSMRLVAGADTGAADTRALRARQANGQLLLADTHYGMGSGLALQLPTPGVSGQFYWMGDSLNQIGFEPGTLINVDEWGGEEAVLALNDMGLGNLVTWAPEGEQPKTVPLPATQQLFSVLRTGTGDLDLLAGGDFTMSSPYGVYTAGTQAKGVDAAYNLPRARVGDTVLGADGAAYEPFVDGGTQSLYRAWYPEHGGNVLVRAQGDVRGDLIGRPSNQTRTDAIGVIRPMMAASTDVGNWLWRQGTGSAVAGSEGVPTAWWINFGSYVPGPSTAYDLFGTVPFMTGFTGIGTLGGGNLVLEAGGDAGMLSRRMDLLGTFVARSTGLNLVVGGSGRVSADGQRLTLTGGGDLDVRIGGGLNPVAELRSFPNGTDITPQTTWQGARPDLNSTFVNLRGALRMQAGSVGGLELRFDRADPEESRAYEVYTATSSIAGGGPMLVPGDAAVQIDARGDLVLGGVVDAGRVAQFNNGTPFVGEGVQRPGDGYSWFSLWTPASGIDLFSAGGNLAPSSAIAGYRDRSDAQPTDGRFVVPSMFSAVAASGSLYYGNAITGAIDTSINKPLQPGTSVMLAPPPAGPQFANAGAGRLELLAGDSIYAGGYSFTASGADPTALPTPFNPGFSGNLEQIWFGMRKLSNVSPDALAPSVFLSPFRPGEDNQVYPLFSLASPSASGYSVPGQQPARFYAAEGDLVGVRTGAIIYRGRGASTGVPGEEATWYEGGGPVALRAGRDVVNAGTGLGEYEEAPVGALGWTTQINRADAGAPLKPIAVELGSARGNLIVHNNPDDVSVVSAGRDVRYSSFYVAGPGLLEVTAGRDLYLADKGELKSIGSVVNGAAGERSSGAGIAVAAGVGARGLDFSAFAARYLDPANLAETGRPLADQPGKAVAVYSGRLTLAQWLQAEFGYAGDEAGAPAYLAGKQAEIDRARAGASGNAAPARDLQREYGQRSQLHLVNWLEERFGDGQRNGLGLRFDAAAMDARDFFAALPAEQQRAFLRPVYYAELKAAGREYNAAGGPREGSYLRGREAIATLFPTHDAEGRAIDYQGDLTMFSSARYFEDMVNAIPTTRPKPGVKYLTKAEWIAIGSPAYYVPHYEVQDAGIHTDFGGDIRVMVPGGRTLVGVDGGFVPGEGSGVLTQGTGDIEIFSNGSILLGQSRVFTTFGGNILAWSAGGDINAGRGSKSTVVYTPQRRVYDELGSVTLSPTTPNTGAGIATLNPVPEVPPGDIDLIAPLGTIDAGEAGIRVSGNVNLAALRVVNAENIQVQGESTGIPVVAAVNVGALSNASAAASQAATAAQEAVQRDRTAQRQALPSVFTVRVLGFGGEAGAGEGGSSSSNTPPARDARAAYDPEGVVQVLGAGTLTAAQKQALTPGERGGLVR